MPKEALELTAVMDASPTDQLTGNPQQWHSIVVVVSTISVYKEVVGHIENHIGRGFRFKDWKHTTSKQTRCQVADAIAALDLGARPWWVAAASSREADISAAMAKHVELLGLGTKYCEHLVNGVHQGISIGPYELEGHAEFCHRFHRDRAAVLLWTAVHLRRLINTMQRDRHLKRHRHNWDILVDLQACDQPHDPWGVKTLAGMVPGPGHRLRLSVVHGRNGPKADAACQFLSLADFLAGLMTHHLSECDKASATRPGIFNAGCSLFRAASQGQWLTWAGVGSASEVRPVTTYQAHPPTSANNNPPPAALAGGGGVP